MSVTLNAESTDRVYQLGVTSVNHDGLTVAAGSGTVLVVVLQFTASVSSISMNWDALGTPQACTSIGSQKENTWPRWVYLYGLLNPTTGNKRLAATWTTSSDVTCDIVAFNGADVSSFAAAFQHGAGANGNNTSAQVAITTASGNAVVAGLTTSGAISGENLTQLFRSTGAGGMYGFASGASLTPTWTIGSNTWGVYGADVVASGGGAGSTDLSAGVWENQSGGTTF